MTDRIGKEARRWERGLVPASFLMLLFSLFLSQLSLPEGAGAGGHPQRMAAEGGVAPSPLPAAGDDLWFPAGGHAERRIVKAKTGLPEGDGAGRAIVPDAGLLLHPFEFASAATYLAVEDAAHAAGRPTAFRSRAPPRAA